MLHIQTQEQIGQMTRPMEPFSSLPRVAWLRAEARGLVNSQHLSEMFVSNGLDVHVLNLTDLVESEIDNFDLILLESMGRMDGPILDAVTRIRQSSLTPLVLVTASYSRNQMIDALSAGVDAVWAIGMSNEMLLARCRALLKRRTLRRL